jgi:hypothetical protein
VAPVRKADGRDLDHAFLEHTLGLLAAIVLQPDRMRGALVDVEIAHALAAFDAQFCGAEAVLVHQHQILLGARVLAGQRGEGGGHIRAQFRLLVRARRGGERGEEKGGGGGADHRSSHCFLATSSPSPSSENS